MINGLRVLAIIPARGGSKGLPNKNIKHLLGKPLISWTIESAQKSKLIDKIFVSTDCEQIAEISRSNGTEVPFLRPSELATDTASSADVVIHVLETLQQKYGESFDYLVLLEPTSPLRKKDDIDQMLQKLERCHNKYDGIVSIGEIHEHPAIMKRIRGDDLVPLLSGENMLARRQELEKVFFPYGVGYIVKVPTFISEKTFYPKKHTFFEIERFQCFEVDDIYDFLTIEKILELEKDKL